MSIVVEHEKRRYEILEKALDVFMEEGFENTTFQKIADKCGITRTTLYIYFKNKKYIFLFSNKQLLQILENDINKAAKESGISYTEKLINVMNVIMDCLKKNYRIFSVVLDYLVYATKVKKNYDPGLRVRRRTVRLRHILTALLIAGKKAGEFSNSINVKDANELLYGILEAATFRLIVMRRTSVDDLKSATSQVVHRLGANPGGAGQKKQN